MSYSPWGRKELDTIERLNNHQRGTDGRGLQDLTDEIRHPQRNSSQIVQGRISLRVLLVAKPARTPEIQRKRDRCPLEQYGNSAQQRGLMDWWGERVLMTTYYREYYCLHLL